MHWILLIILISTVVFFVRKWTGARKLSTLLLLATAIKHELSLPDIIEGYASEFRGRQKRRLLVLADHLREGVMLPVALKASSRMLPEEGQLAVMVGGESGTLAECLESTAAVCQERAERELGYDSYFVQYFLFLILLYFLIVGFIMYFIIPRFQEMFEDFGMDIPRMTEALIILSNTAVSSVGLIVIVMLAVCYLLFLFRAFLVKRFIFFGWISQWLPNNDTSEIMRFLSVNAKVGHPLQGAIDSTARHHSNLYLRRKLEKVCLNIEQGNSIWNSLLKVRLITPWQKANLIAAESNNVLPDTLLRLSHEQEVNYYHQQLMRWEYYRPIIILFMGFLTGIFAACMFLPLVKLTIDLS